MHDLFRPPNAGRPRARPQRPPAHACVTTRTPRAVLRKLGPAQQAVRGESFQFAHFCAIVLTVNGREFITRVRRLARKNGIAVKFDRTRGKGSHGTLYYGERRTVVKDRRKPLKTGTLRGMCGQLGIDPNDL